MRKLTMAVMVVVVSVATLAMAEVKDFSLRPELIGDTVQLNVVVPVNVILYDDVAQAPPRDLGAVQKFKLLPGQGFTVKFLEGDVVYWQLITPKSAVGDGLVINCSSPEGCKYYHPVIR